MRAIICAIAVALGAGPTADDFPPDESALVILAAAFRRQERERYVVAAGESSDTEVASGTWTVKRT